MPCGRFSFHGFTLVCICWITSICTSMFLVWPVGRIIQAMQFKFTLSAHPNSYHVLYVIRALLGCIFSCVHSIPEWLTEKILGPLVVGLVTRVRNAIILYHCSIYRIVIVADFIKYLLTIYLKISFLPLFANVSTEY